MAEKKLDGNATNSFEAKAFGKALVSVETDDVISNEEYRDVKIELFATGHNLVRKDASLSSSFPLSCGFC